MSLDYTHQTLNPIFSIKISKYEIRYISYEIKKVRNSQLLIFEKNGLVWPADIWPAHFFQILKVRKIKLFLLRSWCSQLFERIFHCLGLSYLIFLFMMQYIKLSSNWTINKSVVQQLHTRRHSAIFWHKVIWSQFKIKNAQMFH